MKTIVDSNGIKYNAIEITNNVGFVNKNRNYMPVNPTLSIAITDKDFANNAYSIETINLKDNSINVNITHNFGFNGYNATVTLSCVKNGNIANIGFNTSGTLTTGTARTGTGTYNTTQFATDFIKLIPIAYVKNNTIVALTIAWLRFNNFGSTNLVTPIGDTEQACGVVFDLDYNGITIENDNFVDYREFDSTDNTEEGGGYGTGTMPTDNINIPNLPVINMSDTGATLYSLNAVQMKAFRSWLWTTDWVENLKKIRTDPMQNIIGISITDVPIPSGLSALIYVGNVSSTVEANVITNSFVELDCGSISLTEYYGTFADYEPFCATTLYLPKVGFVQIPADVCINNTIHIIYHIELSSGEGLCYVQLISKRDGFTYIWNTYSCHVNSSITLSAQDHSQQLVALSNAIINTSTTTAGAIANPATSTNGVASAVSNCLNIATTKNPTQTKGNIGNMSAIMCYKKPYLLINRTNLAKPSSFQENNGYLINYTAKISGHAGFLKTRDFHAEFDAPYNHKAEIERLLNEGVFINA